MENIIEIEGKKYLQTIKSVDDIKVEKPVKKEVEKYPKPKFVVTDIVMPTRWNNPPKGLILHFHAGWSDDRINSVNCLNSGKKNGYTYICMEENGDVYFPYSEKDGKKVASFWKHGYHAGHSSHKDHVGLEVMCSGKLQKTSKGFETWYGEKINPKQVRYVEAKDNVKSGWYETYTPEQEQAIIGLCLFLKRNYPTFSFNNVLGHDEVAPRHKNDPGGALSMTMPELRKLLKEIWEAEQ